MKTIFPKAQPSDAHAHSLKPFFNKTCEGAFFPNDKEKEQPFFSSSFIQPPLMISQPNHKYEQEAEAMADNVIHGIEPQSFSSTIQKKCNACKQEEKLQKKENELDDGESENTLEPVDISDWFINEELQSIRSDKIGANNYLLAKGSNGQPVRLLQHALLQWSASKDEQPMGILGEYGADGIFGKKTESAVKAFQTEQQIDNDGFVGPVTIGELDAFLTDKRPLVTEIAGPQSLVKGEKGTWQAMTDIEGTVYNWKVLQENDTEMPFEGGGSQLISFVPPVSGTYQIFVSTSVRPELVFSRSVLVLTAAPPDPIRHLKEGTELKPENIEKILEENDGNVCKSFLKTATGNFFGTKCGPEATRRLGKDIEAGMAIIYEAWRIANSLPVDFFADPAKVKEHHEFVRISTAGNEGTLASEAIYKITFSTKDPSVGIEFVKAPLQEEDVSLTKKQKRQAKSFKFRSKSEFMIDQIKPMKPVRETFPDRSPEDYFKDHPDIELFLYFKLRELWKDNKKGKGNNKKRKLIPVKESPERIAILNIVARFSGKGLKRTMHSDVSYAVEQLKRSDSVDNPLSGFDEKEAFKTPIEKKIEELQQNDHHGITGRKLGAITGLENVPEQEKAAVLETIRLYYENVKINTTSPLAPTPVTDFLDNAEVDITIPIPPTGELVYYTLRLNTLTTAPGAERTDVSVERIDKNNPTFLDPDLPDIQRVPGFPKSGNIKDLTSFVEKRFGKNSLKIDTSKTRFDELVVDLNTQIREKSKSKEWFNDAYKITVIDDKNLAKDHLMNMVKNDLRYLGLSPAQLNNLQRKSTQDQERFIDGHIQDATVFQNQELKSLEMSLETMDKFFLEKLELFTLIRETNVLNDPGTVAGRTINKDKTVILADAAFASKGSIFFGGKQGVHNPLTKTIVHEFGHVIHGENNRQLLIAFFNYVTKHNVQEPTEYAKVGINEFFADSFMFYQLDPEWLQTYHPQLFFWFNELNKNKVPPP